MRPLYHQYLIRNERKQISGFQLVNHDSGTFFEVKERGTAHAIEIRFNQFPALNDDDFNDDITSKMETLFGIRGESLCHVAWHTGAYQTEEGSNTLSAVSLNTILDLIAEKRMRKNEENIGQKEDVLQSSLVYQLVENHFFTKEPSEEETREKLIRIRQKYPEEFAGDMHLLPKSMRSQQTKEEEPVSFGMNAEPFPYAVDRKKRSPQNADNTTFEMEQAGFQFTEALQRNSKARIKFPSYPW